MICWKNLFCRDIIKIKVYRSIAGGGDCVKEMVKALAVHSSLFSKCIAIAVYITGYQNIQQVLETFVDAEKRADRRYIRRLMLDIYFGELYYRISPEEYFWYRFENKTDEERRAYIGYFEKNKLCEEIGDAASKKILADKYECYVFFKEFFGRDVLKVSGQEDQVAFEEFMSKHKEAIVKPIDQSGGLGIYRIAAGNMDVGECFQKVLAGGSCVVEQYIEQVPEMARFHPQSLNTIRIGTFYNTGGVKILFSIFRAGARGAIVDNSAAGGIFASINITNGKVQSDGYVEDGSVYQAHPDTACVFNGFQVPHWSDLLDIVIKAACSFPRHNYICWDFALTDSGWVMVEANSKGEFIGYQVSSGGIRELFMKEFRKYKNQS